MGDENFFKALNNYRNDPLLANGYATTTDLIRHAEAVADTSFREFFDDWIYGSGYPEYTIVYRLNSGNEVEIEVMQETTDPSVDFFEMHLPFKLYGKGIPDAGQSFVVHHTRNGQIFKLHPGFAVDSVKFDPDRWICTANPVILNISEIPYDQQVKVFPNPVSDQLTVHFDLPEEGVNIRLYNQKGQLILTTRTSFNSSETTIPMQSLARGIYTVDIEGRKTVKVVKQ